MGYCENHSPRGQDPASRCKVPEVPLLVGFRLKPTLGVRATTSGRHVRAARAWSTPRALSPEGPWALQSVTAGGEEVERGPSARGALQCILRSSVAYFASLHLLPCRRPWVHLQHETEVTGTQSLTTPPRAPLRLAATIRERLNDCPPKTPTSFLSPGTCDSDLIQQKRTLQI